MTEAVIATSVRSASEPSKEGTLTVDTSWRAEALEYAKSVPATFSAARKGTSERWEDKPFALKVEKDRSWVSIPINKPTSAKAMAAAGFLLEMIGMANIKIVDCTDPDLKSDPWKTVEALGDSLMGSLMAMRNDVLRPIDNIPKPLKKGFEFVLWYAFVEATKETEANTYTCINRTTSLVPTGEAWGNLTQFPEIQAITAIVRACAHRWCNRLDRPKAFLKGEGFFLDKLVGKKPVAGLYTDEEFIRIVKYWSEKQQMVKDAYKKLPDSWGQITGERKLATIMSMFTMRTPDIIKDIEDAKSKRIPNLLVVTGRGKNKTSEIAKGGTLQDKLLSISGGDNPRVCARVMWSPMDSTTHTILADFAIKSARAQLLRKSTYVEAIKDLAQSDPVLYKIVISNEGKIQQVASLIVEVFPDHKGSPIWDTIVS